MLFLRPKPPPVWACYRTLSTSYYTSSFSVFPVAMQWTNPDVTGPSGSFGKSEPGNRLLNGSQLLPEFLVCLVHAEAISRGRSIRILVIVLPPRVNGNTQRHPKKRGRPGTPTRKIPRTRASIKKRACSSTRITTERGLALPTVYLDRDQCASASRTPPSRWVSSPSRSPRRA